jgi:predicted lipid-binding transport protein (Tim44 family)
MSLLARPGASWAAAVDRPPVAKRQPHAGPAGAATGAAPGRACTGPRRTAGGRTEASPWKGILGGALLGLGLGALFSHFGMGGAMASMLGSILMLVLLAGVVFFIIRLIRGKSQPAAQPAALAATTCTRCRRGAPEIGSRLQPAPVPLQPGAHPVGRAGRLRQRQLPARGQGNFIRLQAAGTRAMWPISANSPRRKCLPS